MDKKPPLIAICTRVQPRTKRLLEMLSAQLTLTRGKRFTMADVLETAITKLANDIGITVEEKK